MARRQIGYDILEAERPQDWPDIRETLEPPARPKEGGTILEKLEAHRLERDP